jgi:hypothetical protein
MEVIEREGEMEDMTRFSNRISSRGVGVIIRIITPLTG